MFKGSKDPDCQRGGPYHTYVNKIHRFAEEADKALAMGREERLSLVVELQPSSDEEEEEEEIEEKMDFDRKYN